MKILYVSKSEIYPSFGLCYADGTIKIREDLPQCVKDFLVAHEIYHTTDKETIWWKRELKANWAGMKANMGGFIIAMFMSLSLYRLKYYYQRFKTEV